MVEMIENANDFKEAEMQLEVHEYFFNSTN